MALTFIRPNCCSYCLNAVSSAQVFVHSHCVVERAIFRKNIKKMSFPFGTHAFYLKLNSKQLLFYYLGQKMPYRYLKIDILLYNVIYLVKFAQNQEMAKAWSK